MTDNAKSVADHYSKGGLYDRIVAALAAHKISEQQMEPGHLSAIDEFHIGAAPATRHLLDPLNIEPGHKVLDIGCGIGGTARQIAREYGAEVTGMDLTPDYIETARKLTEHFGQKIDFVVGSALDLPFDDDSFDFVTLLHVGMNLADKFALFSQVWRVLRPNGIFAVYDVMLFGVHPEFPLPWASRPEDSALNPPEIYLNAAKGAGFTLEHSEERRETAKEYFGKMKARMAESGPPMLGPNIMMGDTAPIKIANQTKAVMADAVAPVEMVFCKPG